MLKMAMDGLLYQCVTQEQVDDRDDRPQPRSGASHCCVKLESHAKTLKQNANLSRISPSGNAVSDDDGMKTSLLKDAGTLTDLCCSANLDEVEIVSLVEEQIPRYRLRADTLTQFSGYDNEDWFIPHPALPAESDSEFDLSPDLTKETLDYFVQSGSRVSQMTRTYNDIDAVTRLLEEKEKDLELAARIGQKLLQKNQNLEQKNEALEEEVSSSRDQLTQLRHDLVQKTELLHIYQNHEYDASESDSSEATPTVYLQKKIRTLEEENFLLSQKTHLISVETENLEDKELQLINEFRNQIGDLSSENDRLSEELSTRIEECNRQQEDITHLLAQVAQLQSTKKQLKTENEELLSHLQAAKECQTDLTTELADFKEKYQEVLELLHEAQEQIRNSRRKGVPSATRRGMYSPYINPDSLASELESTISGDSGSFNPNTRQLHNLKVFETVRCAKQLNANSSVANSPSHLPHLYGPPAVHSSTMAGGSICSVPALSSAPQSMSPMHFRGGSLVTTSPRFLSHSRLTFGSLDSAGVSDSEGSVGADGGNDDSYSSISSLGRPGVPGSNDLETALKRLSLRRQCEHEYQANIRPSYEDGTHTPNQCRTPDSIMSTGSGLSAFSGFTGVSGYAIRHYHIPEKLQIVKPMEGSVTLHQWQQLATPHMGGIFEERPGVQIKGERKLEDIDDVYTLTDFEEDEEGSHPGKHFDSTSTVYTYTTSTVLHPDDHTRVTPSGNVPQVSSMVSLPMSCLNSSLNSPQGRERATSTFSTTLSLAKLLHERGFILGEQPASASDQELDTSPLDGKGEPPPATPCNSPDITPPSSPPPFAPLKIPSLAGLGSALSRGSELFGKKRERKESSRGNANDVGSPQVATNTTSGLTNINLMEKINRLGLDSVMVGGGVPSTSSHPSYTLPTYHHMKATSPMTQLTSLRSLTTTIRSPGPNSSITTHTKATTVMQVASGKLRPVVEEHRTRAAPPSTLPLPHMFGVGGPALETGTIGTLASFRKGGLS